MRYLPVLPTPASWPVAGDPLVPLVPVLVEVDPDGSFCVEPVPAPVEPVWLPPTPWLVGSSVVGFFEVPVPFEPLAVPSVFESEAPAPAEPEVPLASRSLAVPSVFESLLVPFESSPVPVWGKALF